MKTTIKILIVLLMLSNIAKTENNDTIKKHNNVFAVSTSKLNVLYIGLDNPVEIAVCNLNFNQISATIDNGEIKKNEDSTWTVRVYSYGNAVIKIFADNNGKKEYIGERIYRVKQIPDPVPMIVGSKEGYIEKNSILIAPYLIAVLKDFLFDGVKFTIVSFEFSTLGEKGMLFTRNLTGSQLSQECLDKCMSARPGQKIFFDNIIAKGPDGIKRPLPALVLIIN
ncbi:MAG: GldM family protein [Bacteroidales bacterium]|nr:GldM family protein [Bacteroidales bacterium]